MIDKKKLDKLLVKYFWVPWVLLALQVCVVVYFVATAGH